MNYKSSLLLVALLSAGTLSACSNAKETLGLTRSSPDEFAVVKRAPLEMPPDYSLRPPRPGAPRPQEQSMNDQARTVVFGSDEEAARRSAPANGKSALLQEAGATSDDPNIRNVVDREAQVVDKSKKPVVERLFGIKRAGTQEDGVIDPKEEAARLKKTQSTPAQ